MAIIPPISPQLRLGGMVGVQHDDNGMLRGRVPDDNYWEKLAVSFLFISIALIAIFTAHFTAAILRRKMMN